MWFNWITKLLLNSLKENQIKCNIDTLIQATYYFQWININATYIKTNPREWLIWILKQDRTTLFTGYGIVNILYLVRFRASNIEFLSLSFLYRNITWHRHRRFDVPASYLYRIGDEHQTADICIMISMVKHSTSTCNIRLYASIDRSELAYAIGLTFGCTCKVKDTKNQMHLQKTKNTQSIACLIIILTIYHHLGLHHIWPLRHSLNMSMEACR